MSESLHVFNYIQTLVARLSRHDNAMCSVSNTDEDVTASQAEDVGASLCKKGYDLLWHDDFVSSASLDNWNYMLYNGCEYGICGWGNNELEWYTNSTKNVRVRNGNLKIIARRASDADRKKCCDGDCKEGECEFTSGRIRTFNKFAVNPSYNKGRREIRIDARIKMPAGEGLWPSFTMLPEDSPKTCSGCGFYGDWPSSGAITVSQKLNKQANYSGGILYGGPPPNVLASTFEKNLGKDVDGYHTYSLVWSPKTMIWKLDGKNVHKAKSSGGRDAPGWFTETQTDNKNAPFDKPFYLMLSLALGGDQTGASSQQVKQTLKSPQSMDVEYIRVCAK